MTKPRNLLVQYFKGSMSQLILYNVSNVTIEADPDNDGKFIAIIDGVDLDDWGANESKEQIEEA